MDEVDPDKDVVAFFAGNRIGTIGRVVVIAVVVAVFGLLWLVMMSRVFLDGGDPSTAEPTPTTVVSGGSAAVSTEPGDSNEIVPTSDIAGAPASHVVRQHDGAHRVGRPVGTARRVDRRIHLSTGIDGGNRRDARSRR